MMEESNIIVPEKKYFKPGHYPNISNADYHSSHGISKTGLDMFAGDQSALEWKDNCPVDEEKLKTLDFGDAMHAISLEPDRLNTDFAVLPELNLRTNIDKEIKRQFLLEHADKKIITFDEHKKLGLMFESIMAHPYARKLIEMPGVAEHSYYWTDLDTGVLCKCRPDRNITGMPILMDVKTTDLISKFHYSVDDYRYYVQSPFYMDGVSACGDHKDRFVFLVIQKTIELGRYPVKCVELKIPTIEYGRSEYKRNLHDYSIAMDTGNFNGIYELEMSYNFNKKINSCN